MPVKILHVFGGGVRSGIETYVISIAKGLNKDGMETILTPLKAGIFIEEAEGIGLKVRKLEKRFKGDPSVIQMLVKIIKEEKIDIIHTHGENGNFYGRIAAKIYKTPRLITTVHTFYRETLRDRYKLSWMRNFAYWQDILTSKLCDAIIAVNNSIRDNLVTAGVNRKKIKVIPNGIDVDNYENVTSGSAELKVSLGLKGNEIVIGTAGRLSLVKNIETLLLAGKEVIKAIPEVRLVIIGDGPQMQYLKKLSLKLGISGYVIFTGWQMDITKYLSIMDIFVNTSLIEGSSFAILEAMALTKPVIATNVGGNPELIVAGETGHLTPFNDANALTSSILDILEDKDKALQMGKAGRKQVETHFHEKQMLKLTKEVYLELME